MTDTYSGVKAWIGGDNFSVAKLLDLLAGRWQCGILSDFGATLERRDMTDINIQVPSLY